MDRMIEMLWTCTSCQNRNLGRYMTCQGCGNPKDGSEEYEMPEDTANAVTLTEASLLRMAEAGPNWQCAYCNSNERSLHNTCSGCGADCPPPATEEEPDHNYFPKEEETDEPTVNDHEINNFDLQPYQDHLEGEYGNDFEEPEKEVADDEKPRFPVWLLVLLSFCILFLGIFLLIVSCRPERVTIPMKLDAARWHSTAVLEAAVWEPDQGFRVPSDARSISSLGMRHHHYKDVCLVRGTESYYVDVPDGYSTKRVSVSRACGETCTTTPKKCKETCKSQENGFAKCKTSCTGGERRCKTKYCDGYEERRVAKTRKEERHRDVCRTKGQESVEEPYYAWLEKDWKTVKTLERSGEGLVAQDPLVEASGSELRLRRGERTLVVDLSAGERKTSLRLDADSSLAQKLRSSNLEAVPVSFVKGEDGGLSNAELDF